jgi:hypothetical protein
MAEIGVHVVYLPDAPETASTILREAVDRPVNVPAL